MEDEARKRSAMLHDAKKRSTLADADRPDVKRMKLDPTEQTTSTSFLDQFDFTALPASLITDLIIVNLEAFSEPALINLVQAFRQSQGGGPSPTITISDDASKDADGQENSMPQGSITLNTTTPEAPQIKDEPIDPLQMDIDQDELDYEPDRLNEEVGILFSTSSSYL